MGDSPEGSPRWRTHTEGVRKVHECKFYDQSAGLIQAVMRRAYDENERGREKKRETSIHGNAQIGETLMTLSAESTNLCEVIVQKSVTVLEKTLRWRDRTFSEKNRNC